MKSERDIRTAIHWLNRAADSGKRKHSPPWAICFGKVAAACGTTKKRTAWTYERQNKSALHALGDHYDQRLGVKREPDRRNSVRKGSGRMTRHAAILTSAVLALSKPSQ